MKLTEKQKRFCEEYLVDRNATQAAIRAGYAKKRASEQAHQLLQKTTVLEYLNDLRKEQSERTRITSDDVISQLKEIAFASVEISGKEKIKALELLGKHLGMFSETANTNSDIHDSSLIDALNNKSHEVFTDED